jgi:5-(carboxyamino)imidazole ribonucleotide synthase
MARLKPGDTIGILGGGQLGRMIALAAADYGLKAAIYQPEKDGPAFDVAAERFTGGYEDEARLADFAKACDVLTYEFENIPAKTVAFLETLKPVRPGLKMLMTSQDRLREKAFVSGLGVETAPYRAVDSAADLGHAVAALGRPSVLKTRRFGYDGKGQVKITPDMEIARAWDIIGGQPAILEGFVPFVREISVIAAGGLDGAFAVYDLCDNEHRDHILFQTKAPAGVRRETRTAALNIVRAIGEGLEAVGVFTVEMFLLRDGSAERLVVNEIAPRVHNSGHWTTEGAETSQFHQHVRAVAGWPLGSTAMTGSEALMQNLIGAECGDWPELVAQPGVHLHLYGKAEHRPGRKMGHWTRVKR